MYIVSACTQPGVEEDVIFDNIKDLSLSQVVSGMHTANFPFDS